MQEFNNRIRELREEKHITQVRLSTELGVAQETISAYEQGRHLPSVTTLIKLSNILGASMDYIMMQSDIRNYIDSESLNNNEIRLINYFKKLNISCKEKALSYIEGLSDGISSNIRNQSKS
ncbi:MAG: helix-turn-helix domain-containing protein [Lachnospira sp.]